jgi:hypothetical protein
VSATAPYAYASILPSLGREREGMPWSEVGAMRQLVKAVGRAHRQSSWRCGVQQRTTAVSRAVRLIEGALGPLLVRRERRGAEWLFFTRLGTEVFGSVSLQLPPSRTLGDLRMPPSVRLLEPGVLGDDVLDRLQRARTSIEVGSEK